jgi:SNF family Na+-dependent transporter
MEQRRRVSLIESTCNTLSGYVIGFVAGLVIFPAFGHRFEHDELAGITLVYTGLSIARGYFWRRAFNWTHKRIATNNS